MAVQTSRRYDSSVFLNCPFEQNYKPILDAIMFCIQDCGFVTRIALQDVGGTPRLAKIIEMIRLSRYSIHDLSLMETTRLNMAFECGIFTGAREFGQGLQKRKDLLVLDGVPHRYRATISDISGQDAAIHNNNPVDAINCVRGFLAKKSGKRVPGAEYIVRRYQRFCSVLPAFAEAAKLSLTELNSLEYLPDLANVMATWQQIDS